MAQKSSLRERHPKMFLPERKVDRSQGRTIPMQVMSLGFPRCGTMSLQAALNILGYNCYHSMEFFTNISDTKLWSTAMDAKFFNKGTPFTTQDWDQLLGSYSAISADPPAIAFAPELISTYPDAKVILVEREFEDWFRSFDNAVIGHMWSSLVNFAGNVDPWVVGPVRDCHAKWMVGWMGASTKEEMRANARRMYKEHYAMVRRITPRERLLEFELSQGWEPLCSFLGKEVPEVAFPRVNDMEHLNEHMHLIVWRGVKNGFIKMAVWLIAGFGVVLSCWLIMRITF